WFPLRSASKSMVGQSSVRDWRSAESRTSLGATAEQKRRWRNRPRPARPSSVPPTRCCAKRAASATTISRLNWRGAPSCGRSPRRRRARRNRKPISGSNEARAMSATSYLGKPTSRIDGPAKVTGAAKYAGEYNVLGLAHGVVGSSAIAKGRIKHIDSAAALAVPGVLDVFTHAHRPPLASSDEKYKDDIAPDGSPFRPLYGEEILFSGQPVAFVVAEEFEIARFAASLVRIEYEQATHVTDFEAQRDRGAVFEPEDPPAHKRGNAVDAFARAPVRVKIEYRMGV